MKGVRGLFCNNCGYSNATDMANCSVCGAVLRHELHISDVALGNVVLCGICGSPNIGDSKYCRVCGRKLAIAPEHPPAPIAAPAFSPAPDPSAGQEPRAAAIAPEPSVAPTPAFIPVISKHENFLERLDKMELDLEAMHSSALPESERGTPDQLDAHEETLKRIAFTLDTLIADLLEAEVREYTFPGFEHSEAKPQAVNDNSVLAIVSDIKKGKSVQEIIVLAALTIAIFLVGMTFGLWGTYFIGL
jgi:hypothetical protein